MSQEIIYAPLVVQGLESFEDDLKEFIVQVRLKSNPNTKWEKSSLGIKEGLVWRSIPIIFDETVQGLTYQVRVAVRFVGGEISAYTSWVDEVAGDTTPPTTITSGNVTLSHVGIYIKCVIVSTYVKTQDFKEFQWHWDVDNSVPKVDADIMSRLILNEIMITPQADISDATLYVWVRAVDQLGNATAWVAKSIALTTRSANDMMFVADALVFE